jgi:hypothetical protein
MKYTIKNNITKVQRSIAYVLLLSELLTSCGFKETILPNIQPQESRPSTCAVLPDTSLVASDSTFQLSTTTIEGTALTFAYTPEAGLQAKYQDAIMPNAMPVQQYPVIQDVTGLKKPFSQLKKAEAALLATSGKWEVNPHGGLSYSGMRGRGGMPLSSGITEREMRIHHRGEGSTLFIYHIEKGYKLVRIKESPKMEKIGKAGWSQAKKLVEGTCNLQDAIQAIDKSDVTIPSVKVGSKSFVNVVDIQGGIGQGKSLDRSEIVNYTIDHSIVFVIAQGYHNERKSPWFFVNGKITSPADFIEGDLILELKKEGIDQEPAPSPAPAPIQSLISSFPSGSAFIPSSVQRKRKENSSSSALIPPSRKSRMYQVSDLTNRKLENPDLLLTIDQSIEVIANCLEVGSDRAESARGKDLLMVIGNTGAGKSTTVNYLTGCTLEKVRKAAIGIKGSGVIVRVQADSAIPEMMSIGHGKTSKTFLPDIHRDEALGFTYCDCPGFLDTRGAEINIANAANIRAAIGLSSSVKVLLLINYHSLQADRCKGLNDMHKILIDLFGDASTLKKNLKSVLIGITKVPTTDSEGPESIAELRSEFADEKLLASNQEHIITFDPLDECITGGFQRNALITRIRELDPIEHPGYIFRTVLLAEDERKLREISQTLNARIQEGLRSHAYSQVRDSFLTFHQLDKIDHVFVKSLYGEIKINILRQLDKIYTDVTLLSMNEQFSEAEKIVIQLDHMSKALSDIKLSDIKDCSSISDHYQKNADFLKRAKQRYAETKDNQEKLIHLQDELGRVIGLIVDYQKREEDSKSFQASLQAQMQQIQQESESSKKQLEREQATSISKLRAEMATANEEDRKNLEESQRRLEADYETRLANMEKYKQEALSQQEAAIQIAQEQLDQLKKNKKALERKKTGLQEASAATSVQGRLTEVQRILGDNYVGEAAWKQLDITVSPQDLPAVTEDLLSRIKAMQTKREQPLLVLDLGKSIAEMEKLCKAKRITVLKADGDDKKLRAETCYKAVGVGSRWLLLPGSDHGVLPGSRNKTYDNQVKYMKSNYPGYAVGGARELVTVAMLKQIQDGTVLFSNQPVTFGRCKEQYQKGEFKGYQICLGGVQASSSSGCGGLVVAPYHLLASSDHGLVCFLS